MKFRVLLICLLIISQLAFAQETQTSEQLYQEAYENFVKRDYSAASASLDKINPVDQKKADILNLRGAIYKRLGELDNAANAYSDALKVNPKDWVPKYNLAEVNFLREQYKVSRTFLEQALASMPEADRLQKQDLILYKVYLTYLLQGDDEKAKLLLDSFDINSSNPVYYFAQAAWSYKKKDNAKAKTWINSTDGLYSQDLRNSYGQALVDIGWLEPSAAVGATGLNTSPSPTAATTATSPTPATMMAAASPTSADNFSSSVVPLATGNATPIAVAEATATPVAATPETVPAATVPNVAAMTDQKDTEKEGGFPWTWALFFVGIIAAAAILLMNLAKRSKIVPPPEDNTGYDAIVASGNPEASALIAHSSEGTGAVLEQDHNGNVVAPAAIKVMPIHRDYAELEPVATSSEKPKTIKTSTRMRASAAPALKPAPATSKAATKVPTKLPSSTKNTPGKIVPAKTAPVVPVVPVIQLVSKKPVMKPAAKPVSKPATKKTTAPAPAPAPEPLKVIAKKVATKSKPAPVPVKLAPIVAPVVVEKAPAKKGAVKTAPVVKLSASTSIAAPRRTRLIPIPTINVPPPAVAPVKLMVSNIETLKFDPTKAKAPAKAKVAAKPKVAIKAPAKTSVARSSAPLITIPEFEDNNLENVSSPVIRLIPEAATTTEDSENV